MPMKVKGLGLDALSRDFRERDPSGGRATILAHDMRNVLQAVAGVAHLMEHAAEDAARIVALAQTLAEAVRRGNTLTARALRCAHAPPDGDASDTKPMDGSCNRRDVVERLCLYLSQTLDRPHAIRCEMDGATLPPMVRGDAVALEAALMNLIFKTPATRRRRAAR